MIHETTLDFRIRYNLSQSGLNRTRMVNNFVVKKEGAIVTDIKNKIGQAMEKNFEEGLFVNLD